MTNIVEVAVGKECFHPPCVEVARGDSVCFVRAKDRTGAVTIALSTGLFDQQSVTIHGNETRASATIKHNAPVGTFQHAFSAPKAEPQAPMTGSVTVKSGQDT
ncbi:hypothetical protein [Sorangium sp. So ce406]|uniref:hypothetical protein n=1 Tax=Sorangium sp. So ce406 TaxID=3133311 RepID=UPI003F5C271B